MRGEWLIKVARRITYAETFASIVEPAIADMQFETAAKPSAAVILRSYLSVYAALAAAILRDVRTDARFAASHSYAPNDIGPSLLVAFLLQDLWHIRPPGSVLHSAGSEAYFVLLASRLPMILCALVAPTLSLIRAVQLRLSGLNSVRVLRATAATCTLAAAISSVALIAVVPKVEAAGLRYAAELATSAGLGKEFIAEVFRPADSVGAWFISALIYGSGLWGFAAAASEARRRAVLFGMLFGAFLLLMVAGNGIALATTGRAPDWLLAMDMLLSGVVVLVYRRCTEPTDAARG